MTVTQNILGHDGIVTIKNTNTGNHRTFKLHTLDDGRRRVALRNKDAGYDDFAVVRGKRLVVLPSFRGDPDGKRSVFEIYARMLTSPKDWTPKGAQYLTNFK